MASRSFIDYLLNPGPDEAELQEAIRSAAGVADDIAAAFVAIDAAVAATAADVVTINAQITYIDGVVADFTTDAAAAIAAIAADRASALAAIASASTTAQGAIDATADAAVATVNTARDDAIAATDAGVAAIAAAIVTAEADLDAAGDAFNTAALIIQANTENFRDEAETARDEAVAAAASVAIPVIAPGDAGKVLTVKLDETGSEWVDAGVDLPAGGTTGQVLTKQSAAEQDADWETPLSATTAQKGILELATDAEAIAGSDTERGIVPSSLAATFSAHGEGMIGGRLSLVSGDPVPEADVVGASTVYLIASITDHTSLYIGGRWKPYKFTQISLALVASHLADNNYDVWEFDNAGALAIGTGPSWAAGAVAGSSYLRGTGAGSTELEMFEGRLVNKVAMTVRNGATTYAVAAREARLRGTIRMTANGVTEDSMVKRFVSNLYNPELRTMVRAETADSWTYSTAAWRMANGSNSNRVQYVQCVAGRRTKCTVAGIAYNSTSTLRNVAVGIGINTATINNATRWIGGLAGSVFCFPTARYDGYPGLGHRVMNWIERGNGSDTQTWVGDFAQPDFFQTGIEAETLL